ncbi:hypothetical protein DH2020_023401 [Rehmannia glutinosa]|uniref:Uncharacterized protein n=1 Tax=Rehmannia glutinosa TaxID=99300 RepID=A0ABR0W5Y3_REHGL
MPSVTWGVIQGRKEKLVSRVIICDYLKSIGIVPDELEELELPSTVDVMRERVELLRKNWNSRARMGEFVKNYPQCLHTSVVVELVPVVRFLRGLDVEKQDIGYVLMKYPELLGFKLEGTMSTSVAYLISIGVNPRDIGPMVTQYPYILGMRVGTMIKPLVDYLVSLGLPKKILARMFEKRAYILGYDLKETVKPNVDCLISFGIRKEVIASVIAQYPQILGLPLKAKLSSQQYFFNLKLKIDPDGFARVIERMPQINHGSNHGTRDYRVRGLDVRWRGFLIVVIIGLKKDFKVHILRQRALVRRFSMGGKLQLPGADIVSEEEDESDDEILYRRTVSL